MSFSNQVLVESLIQYLEQRKQTFGIAESCTCGLLAAAFSYRPGISQMFMGGVVSYANEAKEMYLNVKPQSLRLFGAVSKEVAKEMAQGLRERLKIDWALSVTGIAGPSGGTPDKPVGTVCFAVLGPHFEEVRRQMFSGNRQAIQNASVDYALRFFLESLNRSIR